MLNFTYGPPDDMQVLIACGIATYLLVFPLVIFAAAVFGEVWCRSQPDEPSAARAPGVAPTSDQARQRGVTAPVASPYEAAAGTAA